jgi:fibronectin type 3 domain-containing protein
MKSGVIRLLICALMLVVSFAGVGAQDQTSRTYSIPVSHVVTISWDASTTPGCTYNVYYSLTSGGPYILLGSTSLLSFMDIDVSAGQTYYYVVAAVNSSGVQSVYSGEISVTIPIP